jgi:D-amino peptidase
MTSTILISADMEGATGATVPDDVIPGAPGWATARECWTQDVNTVIDALLAGGADEVLVTDAHANGSGLEPARIDSRAGLVRGRSRRFGMLEGIDGGVHGVVFLGYHGTAGSGGVLSHAYMTAGIHALRVNGNPAGEGTVNAHLASWFGVPVILVSGDDIACAEAARYAAGAPQVCTKQALNRYAARHRPPAAVHRDLATATGTALKTLRDRGFPDPRPPAGTEVAAEIEFSSENCALAATAVPGVQQTGPRSVSYTSSDVARWYRCLGAIWTLARSARDGTYG